MRRTVAFRRLLAVSALVLGVWAAPRLAARGAEAQGLPIATSEGAWVLKAHDRLEIWANSPEAGLALDNTQGRGFWSLTATWQNCLAGAFVSTPEGVVAGTSRDGGAISTSLTVQPGQSQRWALRPNVTGAYRFAVVSGTGLPGPQPLYKAMHDAAVARNVSFAIHLGNGLDARKGPRRLQAFRDQLRGWRFPTYCLPGYQEALAAPGRLAAWSQLFGSLPLSFRVGPDQFLMLADPGGVLAPAEERWLSNALEQASASKARRIFVFLSRPLVDVRVGRNHGMQDVVQARRLLGLFGRHHVETVFGGHIGMFAVERRKGVRLVTSGGGGQPLNAAPSRGGYHHWVRVDVSADGAVTITPERLHAKR